MVLLMRPPKTAVGDLPWRRHWLGSGAGIRKCAPLCRVSGNVVNDFVLGSITSAVQVYGVRLIVVLGHTRCGMVARAIQHWAKHEHKKAQESLSATSNQVRPSDHRRLREASAALSACWLGKLSQMCVCIVSPSCMFCERKTVRVIDWVGELLARSPP